MLPKCRALREKRRREAGDASAGESNRVSQGHRVECESEVFSPGCTDLSPLPLDSWTPGLWSQSPPRRLQGADMTGQHYRSMDRLRCVIAIIASVEDVIEW